MRLVDGRDLTLPLELEAEVVVVGSGPAGSAVARSLAGSGLDVTVVEAGPWVGPEAVPISSLAAMSTLYRSWGASVVAGPAPWPYVQGKMVGGSSPINGAICWRLPRDVQADWLREDPGLGDVLSWDALERLTDEVEARLGVASTEPAVAGRKNELMALGAERLGLAHRPIRRNVSGCEGLGRCMQGCPGGHKASVDRTLLSDALASRARVVSSVEVTHVEHRRGRAVGVRGVGPRGTPVSVRASEAVVLAASAVQTPALLLRSGLRDGPVGEHFSCHPGVSLAGRFAEPVRMWEGATQGHEVIGLRREGLKFEALGFGLAVLAARLDGVGRELAVEIGEMAHWVDWGVAVKASSRGRVRSVGGRTLVSYASNAADVRAFRRGLRVLGELMLAAGAEVVSPGVKGFDPRVSTVADLERLERSGPSRSGAYKAAITHMFGTCRIGSDPASSVVRPDFRHHRVAGLYVADSSVFPSNIGVNPQVPIMAVAARCAERLIATLGAAAVGAAPAVVSPRHVVSPEPSESKMSEPSAAALTLEDLIAMSSTELAGVMRRGHPLDPEQLANTQYLGVDLSLPPWAGRLLWKTFRKTFHRDAPSGKLRGWNVKMEQTGVRGAAIPKTDRRGNERTFGHYVVVPNHTSSLTAGWQGASLLDYGAAGNPKTDPARFGYTPIVAVNPGSQRLLLGWEVFRVAGRFLPVPLYWALELQGPLEEVVAPPR